MVQCDYQFPDTHAALTFVDCSAVESETHGRPDDLTWCTERSQQILVPRANCRPTGRFLAILSATLEQLHVCDYQQTILNVIVALTCIVACVRFSKTANAK
jgi:hypothetical protein